MSDQIPDDLLPAWREAVAERDVLRARVDKLEAERDEARDELGTANGTNAVLAAHLASTAESLQTAEAVRDELRARVDALTRIAWLARQDRFGDARELAIAYFDALAAGGVST